MQLLDLFTLDVKTLLGVLFFYNLLAIIINVTYAITTKNRSDSNLLKIMSMGKFFQACAFFCLFYRNQLPDILSVNFGNSFLFIGFYAEALSIYELLGLYNKRKQVMMTTFLVFSLLFFNIMEFILRDPNFRIISSSICVFVLLLTPSITLLINKKSNAFKRVMGIFYMITNALLLPRIILTYSIHTIYLFTNTLVQSLVFISLLMLNILSSSTFLLLTKESSDNALKMLATLDYLTKLPNRYSFLHSADISFQVHQKNKHSFTVLFFDLDNFKKVTDKYGHAFGDQVLIRFADILSSNLRPTDFACRYGGDEFLIILPNSSHVLGCTIGERILDEVRHTHFEEYPDFNFTSSVGIVCGIPSESDTLEQYIEAADQLLNRAKNHGKNTIDGALYPVSS